MKKIIKDAPKADWILVRDLAAGMSDDKFYAFKDDNVVYQLVRLSSSNYAFVIINNPSLYCSKMGVYTTKKDALKAVFEWEFFPTGGAILQFDTYKEMINYFFG